MKLNEYGIFEYAKNGHSLGALAPRSSRIEIGKMPVPAFSVSFHLRGMENERNPVAADVQDRPLLDEPEFPKGEERRLR